MNINLAHQYYPKDFIETAEGLVFAVVAEGIEADRVLCFLRYVASESGWQKLATEQANEYLYQKNPEYHYYSANKSAHLHAVPLKHILCHYRPRERLQKLLAGKSSDSVVADLLQLLRLFELKGMPSTDIGVTGSVLIGAQRDSSDLDLVLYERDAFHRARNIFKQLISENHLQALSEEDWREAFDRRNCDLSFAEYLWHEQRKFNKAMINGRKVDISLLNLGENSHAPAFKKIGLVEKVCKVLDVKLSFDYPAQYQVEDNDIDAVVCFTATYQGQASAGEWIQVTGHLEESADGARRIVVGSNREARGEFIKVVTRHD